MVRVCGFTRSYAGILNRFENGIRRLSRERFDIIQKYLKIGITYEEYLAGILPNEKRYREIVCRRCQHINKVEIRD